MDLPMYNAKGGMWEKKGLCGFEYVLSEWKRTIPSLTYETLWEICVVPVLERRVRLKRLDADGIETDIYDHNYFHDQKENATFNLERMKEMGCTTRMLELFAIKYNINLVAIDFDNQIFHRYFPEKRSRKHSSMIYKIANSHIYPITNTNMKKSIIAQNREQTDQVSSGCVKGKDKKKEEAEEEKGEVKRDVVIVKGEKYNVEDLEKVKDNTDIFFTHKKFDLMNLWVDLIKKDKAYYESLDTSTMFYRDNVLTCFEYVRGVRCYWNAKYESVMAYCEKFNIKFRNQTLTSVALDVFAQKKPDFIKSTFNEHVNKIFESDAMKHIAFNDVYHIPPSFDNVTCFDINKCYTACVMKNKYRWPVFTIFDKVERYSGEALGCGYYYVETDNYLPLRGNGWYSRALIEYAQKQGIKMNIKYKLMASESLPADYFNDFFMYLVRECGKDAKIMINSFIGVLNKKMRTTIESQFTTDINQASHYYLKNNTTHIENISTQEQPLYNCKKKKTVRYTDVSVPIYNQILDNSAIALHKLIKKSVGEKSKLLKVKTDAVFVLNPKEVRLRKKIGQYQVEKINPESHFNYVRKGEPRDEEYKHGKEQWNHLTDVDIYAKQYGELEAMPRKEYIKRMTTVRDEIIEKVIDSKQGCHISGLAGTGKTHTVNKLVDKLKEEGKKVMRLAPTNVSAKLVFGQTIHKGLCLGITDLRIPSKRMHFLKTLDVIVIDETSMVSGAMYKLLLNLQKMAPNLKYILVGDFAQIPAIEENKRDYKNSVVLKELCDFNHVELCYNMRSDNIMFNIYKKVIAGENIDLGMFGKEHKMINICFTNAKRKEINRRCMDILKEEGKEYVEIKALEKEIGVDGVIHEGSKNQTQHLYLFKGSPIISKRNNNKTGWVNNETGKVVRWNEKGVEVVSNDDDKKKTFVPLQHFQKFYLVNYCMTVDKSQGQTFTQPYAIHQWHRMCVNKQYVAISRTTDIKHLNIIQSERRVRAHTVEEVIGNKIEGHKREDRAQGRGECTLTVEQVKEMLEECKGCCAHCGLEVKTQGYECKASRQLSIDRVDNSKAHTRENCVVSCYGCNLRKEYEGRSKVKVTEWEE